MGSGSTTASPDFVLILTDQERFAPAYESHDLAKWRARALPGRRWFQDNGVSFERHYAGATACVPSRPTLLTGHYPDTHGVTQTTGMAKQADDPRVRWLRPGEVPTLGHWLRAAGYDTHYEGKWHVSDADLVDGDTGLPLRSNRSDGTLIEEAVARYEAAQCLEPFGFSGWLGPEPHGAERGNSGLVRDRITAERAVRFLTDRHRRRQAGDEAARAPFCLVVCFVNPHDIVFWPAWALRSPLPADPLDPPQVPQSPTEFEDLRDKPALQAAYRDAYYGMYGAAPLIRAAYRGRAAQYRSTYMRLHLEVDRQIDRVRRTALSGPNGDGTVLVLSSDHGELLGSHGGLHQKWYNLYDEAVRVPFTVAHTGAFGPRGLRQARQLTSHVDLLPTLLGLSGAEPARLQAALAKTHTEVHDLVGRDLSGLITGKEVDQASPSVYLMTRDNIAEGAEERSLGARLRGRKEAKGLAVMGLPAFVASNLEAVVAWHEGSLWKLVRTYDDPATWTEPGLRQLADRGRAGHRYRSQPIADEWELYDLSQDPAEARNRARDPDCADALQALQAELELVRTRALPARHTPWPYATQPAILDDPRQDRSPGERRQVMRQRRLRVPVERVWARLADFGALHQWFADAQHSSLLGEQAQGVGAQRRVQMAAGTLVETASVWEPQARLSYEVEGLPPLLHAARNQWSLRALGDETDVRVCIEVELASGPAARLAYGTVIQRVLSRSLDHLVDGLARDLE